MHKDHQSKQAIHRQEIGKIIGKGSRKSLTLGAAKKQKIAQDSVEELSSEMLSSVNSGGIKHEKTRQRR